MRVGLASLLLLLLGACAAEADTMQVLRGAVRGDGLDRAPVEVHAIRDGQLVGASPLAADGSFALALPTGDPARLVLVDERGEAVAWLVGENLEPTSVRVCTPGGPLQLGRITTHEGLCVSSGACRSAQALRDECLQVAERACSRLQPEVATCLDERLDACEMAAGRRNACLVIAPPEECEYESYLARTCNGAETCEELMLTYWARCGFPCEGLESLVSRVCPACTKPDAVVAEFPPPVALRCEGAE